MNNEIASRVGRTEKTIRSWAEAEGWKQARREMISMRSGTVEKLQTLVDKVADRMIRDCDGAEELSPQSLHALTNLVTALKNYYACDGKAKVEEQASARHSPRRTRTSATSSPLKNIHPGAPSGAFTFPARTKTPEKSTSNTACVTRKFSTWWQKTPALRKPRTTTASTAWRG